MNKKAEKLYRGVIKGFPEKTDTSTDELIKSIIEKTNQTAINKTDEVELMQCMLNDKDFKVAIYDRNKGYLGSRSPRCDAISIAVDTLAGATGMSTVEAYALTEDYEFTKRDASRFINIGKDFISTYLQTGRKMNLVSEPRCEATVNLRYVEEHDKNVPDRENPGKVKTVRAAESIKMVCTNKRGNR